MYICDIWGDSLWKQLAWIKLKRGCAILPRISFSSKKLQMRWFVLPVIYFIYVCTSGGNWLPLYAPSMIVCWCVCSGLPCPPLSLWTRATMPNPGIQSWKMSRIWRIYSCKIWFVDIGPCKRFDIFQLYPVLFTILWTTKDNQPCTTRDWWGQEPMCGT